MFNFTPLLGAQAELRASQSLLELDGGVKVLVDVGWDEAFDAAQLQAVEKEVPSLSLILLTHATVDHLGAYAHCCKHIPLFDKVPVYATAPVINLGRTLLLDLYASSPLAASFIPATAVSSPDTASPSDFSPNLLLEPPTAEEIGSYFNRINALKYSQPHQPTSATWAPASSGLTITAYSAGHTLGGTVWHIQQSMESVVYAADFNQGRENLLPGTSIIAGGSEVIDPLRRPTALVCSAKGVERTGVIRGTKDRDEVLINLIREAIAQGGKVLIPTDSSARVLELAFLLNQTWRDNIDGPHAETYKHTCIYMAAKSASTTVRYLQSMLEWVNDAVRSGTEAFMTNKGKDFQYSPLDWHHVKPIEKQSHLDKALARSRPCVMLASDASVEWGFSRLALEKLAADPRNLVILTEDATSAGRRGLGRQLWEAWQTQPGQTSAQSGAKIVDCDGMNVQLQEASITSLNDNELALYETYTARQRQLHSALQGDNTDVDPATALEEQEEESDEEEDADDQQQGRALNVSAQLTQSNKRKVGLSDAELGVNVLLQRKGVYDYDVRQSNRGRDKVFPFITHRNREDDYGEVIKADDYVRAEERNDVDGVDMRNGAKQEIAIGQKRKWDDATSNNARGGRRGSKSQNKRQRQGKSKPHEPDDIDAAIARATGESLLGAATNGANDESSETEESDYEPEELESKGPQKVVFTTQQLTLRMKLAHVDYSGLHEKRDLQMIIPLMHPRKLVLISGSPSETKSLADACQEAFAKQKDAATTIFTPVVGETVDASVDTNAWTLKLSRELLKRIRFQTPRPGLDIVAVTGRLTLEQAEAKDKETGDETAKKKVKLAKPEPDMEMTDVSDDKAKSMPVLDIMSLSDTSTGVQQRISQPVHVGDLRLAGLRDILLAQNHDAKFTGEGTLLVDYRVVVRKNASGRIEVESTANAMEHLGWRTKDNAPTFFAVKKAVYDGLAVVGAA
jgi:cleavage and polyadenylation specificity factor subunit 2